MTSSHRPALKAARRCIRPLTMGSIQNDPGALKRRLTTRRTALSTWPEPMGSWRASRVIYRIRWAWVSREPKARVMALLRCVVAKPVQRLLDHLNPVCLVPQRMPQALVERVALGLGHGVARGNGLGEILTGMGESQDLHSLGSGNLGQRAQALNPMPHPFGPIGDTLHHLRIGRTKEPHIADQQGPDGLGVPHEDIVERQPQAIGLALLVEDVNHQHPWLAPGGRTAVVSLRRLPTAGRTPRTHASTIEADADPLAGQR